jgi:hypothetical protein
LEFGIGHRASGIGSRKLKPFSFGYAGRQVLLRASCFLLLASSFFIIDRSQILGERKMHPFKADCQPKFVSFH